MDAGGPDGVQDRCIDGLSEEDLPDIILSDWVLSPARRKRLCVDGICSESLVAPEVLPGPVRGAHDIGLNGPWIPRRAR